MSNENEEALNALRNEIRNKGADFFEDTIYQTQVVERLEVLGEFETGGNVAEQLGLSEIAQGLWKQALESKDLNSWSRKSLLEKVGDEEALRAIAQEEFDTGKYAYSVIEAGEKLGLDRDAIVARVLPMLEADDRQTEQASSYMKLGFSDKAIELTLADFAQKDARRQQQLRSYSGAERAEQIYRHDMSHAINRAVSVGDLETIKEGYREFMSSVIREGNAMYVERLIEHYETAKEKFAEQGIEIDPNDFFFAEDKDAVLAIAQKGAMYDNEYGSGAKLAADLFELAGQHEKATEYKEMAKQKKESRQSNKGSNGPSFEELVAEEKFSTAFQNAMWDGDKEKAESVYEKAIGQVFDEGWQAGRKAGEMARFLGKEEDAKLYDVLKLI